MRRTRIVLVRHGDSRAQEDGFVAGHTGCTGLSNLGRRQVAALGDRWEETHEVRGPVPLYSSVMRRAVETAEILAPALGDPEIEQDCDLCERHPVGEVDGLSYAEANARYPAEPDDGSDPAARPYPGFETWNEMAVRVARGFDRLVERHPGKEIVVATHGGVIVQSFIRWFGLAPPGGRDRAWLGPMNASITEWQHSRDPYGGHWGWELVRFNDYAHVTSNGLVPPW